MSEMANRSKKDKNQHIQVFVRVRPSNQSESCGKSFNVIDVTNIKELLVRERPQDKMTKKFTFDRVFGPKSKQLDVYTSVVNPFVAEVLAGYNCTVFAYGQTGTGKTFTMEGLANDPAIHWQSDSTAGIIPRSLSHLFDELRILGAQEYTVKVSFLELYNEELFDLLSANEDASKLKLFEDSTKKGSVIIQGLEEVIVHNKDEVYKILQRGSERRQTAATMMNATSSRSHTVFSITVHMKECSVEGEELIKTGKLNLVDLAGSENVGRSGAVDKRAREAGNINQSLLTLGRVITALVERAPHIPYRESKLTRLLQDSLGGRTKTSIIATISPSSLNLEETLSTLDYAHRAKNITNRPEINQKLTKTTLIKEYTEEIERLKRDLYATRERNGVYLSEEDYKQLLANCDFQGKEIEEKIQLIKALQEELENKNKLFEQTSEQLKETCHQVRVIKQDRDEQKHLVENLENITETLSNQASTLLEVANTATDHTQRLHDKIARKNYVENENEHLRISFASKIDESFKQLVSDVNKYSTELISDSKSIEQFVCQRTDAHRAAIKEFVDKKDLDVAKYDGQLAGIGEFSVSNADSYKKWFVDVVDRAKEIDDVEKKSLVNISDHFGNELKRLVENKIADNLAALDKDLQSKLKRLRQQLQITVTDLYLKQNEEINLVTAELADIRKQLVVSNDLSSTNTRHQKELDGIMKAMMDNYLRISNEITVNCDTVIKSAEYGIQKVEIADQKVGLMLDDNQGLKSFVDGQVTNDFKEVQELLGDAVKANCRIAEETVAAGDKLAGKLKNSLANASQEVTDYREKVEGQMAKAIELVDKDQEVLGNRIKDLGGSIREDVDVDRDLMNKFQGEVNLMIEELGSLTVETEKKVRNKEKALVESVEGIDGDVKRFLVEEIKKDIPTGMTPVKKDFEYPRQIVEMSPRERIVERFRKWRETHPEEDQDVTIKCEELDETEVILPTPIVKRSKSFERTKSEDGQGRLIKAASDIQMQSFETSNSSDLLRSSLTSNGDTSSDEFICSNKENGNRTGKRSGDKRVSKQPKFIPRSKGTAKKVLTSHND
ncbi:kinesin-like protein Klp61F [Microplitis demolitor]|uniref:kinesin-like protein Klp61F n=1 Tax=Microplitis demolitor TaxID=69319 RepID=UPI00043FFEEA|nr:kinesin-like protein Klp61F [Microplitis demolitor]